MLPCVCRFPAISLDGFLLNTQITRHHRCKAIPRSLQSHSGSFSCPSVPQLCPTLGMQPSNFSFLALLISFALCTVLTGFEFLVCLFPRSAVGTRGLEISFVHCVNGDAAYCRMCIKSFAYKCTPAVLPSHPKVQREVPNVKSCTPTCSVDRATVMRKKRMRFILFRPGMCLISR